METNSAENTENSTKNTVINKQNEEVNLLSLSVVRRDGSITPFKSDKIANAIRKAFLAQTDVRDNTKIDQTVNDITETVTGALTRRIANGDMIHIEDIQDQVELALMRGEHHKVARAYVLYREQRAKQRYKTAKLNEQVGAKVSTMAVTKRDGHKEDISLEKITNRISVLSNGLEIDPITIAQKAIQGLYDGITTNEIDTYLAETAAALTVEHPDYSYLAGRIKANALHKETPGFIIATKNLFEDGLLREEYYQKAMAHAEDIEKIIDKIPNNNDDFRNIRDKALILIGFYSFCRRSELLGMKYEHLNFEDDGVQVLIPFSKTDQQGEGRMIYLPKNNSPYCPVSALKKWLDVALIDSGPLFYKINKANNIEKYILNNKNQKVSLTDTSFVLILKKRAEEAGIENCDKISGHSLRIGSITQARMNGVPTHEIMAQSGHKTTQMIDRYTKLTNIKETSAAKKL